MLSMSGYWLYCKDVLLEENKDVVELLTWFWQMSFNDIVPEKNQRAKLTDYAYRVATKYPNCARTYFNKLVCKMKS